MTQYTVHGRLVTQTSFKEQVTGSYTTDQKSLGMEVWFSSRVLWLAWQQPWILSQYHDKGKKKKKAVQSQFTVGNELQLYFVQHLTYQSSLLFPPFDLLISSSQAAIPVQRDCPTDLLTQDRQAKHQCTNDLLTY